MENSAGISFMGFTRMDLESAVCFLCAVVFSLFLMVFSWQDLHRKRIRVSWLYGFGTAGMALTMIRCVLSVIKDGWDWKKSALQITVWLLGMLPGIFLFWMERQTKGAVGLGDGCFFLITGCYLGGWRTLELLMGAVFVSSLAGGVCANKYPYSLIRTSDAPISSSSRFSSLANRSCFFVLGQVSYASSDCVSYDTYFKKRSTAVVMKNHPLFLLNPGSAVPDNGLIYPGGF